MHNFSNFTKHYALSENVIAGGKLLTITFDVGRVTSEKYVHFTRNFRKTHILVRFEEYVDKILNLFFGKW